MIPNRKIVAACVMVTLLWTGAPAWANGGADAIDVLRAELARARAAYEQHIIELEARLEALEEAQAAADEAALAEEQNAEPMPPQAPALASAAAPGGSYMQIGLSGLFTGGASSVNNEDLAGLQAGAHDPNRTGFTVQNVELSLTAAVDPYFDAQTNIIFQIDGEGETVVELEEAFFLSRALPGGLQLKGGQFYTEFGRHNPQHPHAWSFADQPLILSRLFGGDGLRSQGARLSWLIPAPWYAELYAGAQNARGETVVSFLGEGAGEDGDEEIGGHGLVDRAARNFGDLLYSARLLNGFDLSDTTSMNLGASLLWGPNAGGQDTDTVIFGADAYVKWQPAYSQRGFPFVSWHSEVLARRFEAGDGDDPVRETLRDWGFFGQALWGFKPGWVAGLRLEHADAAQGAGRRDDPLRDKRTRLSPNLTWYPTEFSKIRLQYNHDWLQHLNRDSADSLWLQVEFSIGDHMAHKF